MDTGEGWLSFPIFGISTSFCPNDISSYLFLVMIRNLKKILVFALKVCLNINTFMALCLSLFERTV